MYFGGCRICVLDIETTGLAPGNSCFVLGSLLSFEGGNEVLLKQYFAEDISEEKELLTVYIEEAIKYDVLLTYNGRNFDIPFLLSRMEKSGFDVIKMPYNLDMYLVLNGHSPLRKFLPNLKQKTVEDFMGLWPYREDKISGRESAMLYPNCRELLLLHNRDDVLQLARLLPVLEKVDFHKAMYSLGFPVISGFRTVHLERINFDGNRLKASGTQYNKPADYVSYGSEEGDCVIRFVKKSASFEISVPVLKKSGAVTVDALSLFPNHETGYIVLKNSGDINYVAVTGFIQAFLLKAQGILPEEPA